MSKPLKVLKTKMGMLMCPQCYAKHTPWEPEADGLYHCPNCRKVSRPQKG